MQEGAALEGASLFEPTLEYGMKSVPLPETEPLWHIDTRGVSIRYQYYGLIRISSDKCMIGEHPMPILRITV